MNAAELSSAERVVVARFGLDRPEGEPLRFTDMPGEILAHRDRAARIRALEVEARDEYDALRLDEAASVSDLVGAEARVVALAAAADIAEGVVI